MIPIMRRPVTSSNRKKIDSPCGRIRLRGSSSDAESRGRGSSEPVVADVAGLRIDSEVTGIDLETSDEMIDGDSISLDRTPNLRFLGKAIAIVGAFRRTEMDKASADAGCEEKDCITAPTSSRKQNLLVIMVRWLS